jgi:DNA-binding transcriptional ArsR family regulator
MHKHAYIKRVNLEEAQARAKILKAMAHPARLILVEALSRGDRCVCDLQPLLAVDQSVLSRHLAHLKYAGIVTERREGVRIIHHLECPCILDALDCTLGVMKADAKRRNRILSRA